jgi:phytoene dehydrogenase-like protein
MASGDMLGWNAMIHKSGAKRAKGGSGALTQAMAKCLLAHGGEIICNAHVEVVRPKDDHFEVGYRIPANSDGGVGKQLERGREDDSWIMQTKKVVGACHLHTFFGMIPEPPSIDQRFEAIRELKRRVARTRIGNGFGMIVRHAVEELPDYGDASAPAGPLPGTRDYQTSLQLLCPSIDYLNSSHRDFMFGLPPREPSVVAMSFSSLDPTLAPPGKHVLFTWGQYHPYELSNGEDWDSIREREADKLYDLVCRYAPNMRGKMIARHIQTPLDIERTLGLLRANVMHLEMSLDQMFMFRPLPELANYKVPGLPGLYLTGASTHPGGGVFAASGYNTARVILAE